MGSPDVGAVGEFAAQFHAALREIVHPRYYSTERGYQGELLRALHKRFPELVEDGGGYLVEQEYQKQKALHGIQSRPDIIIHQPFDDTKHANRREGNFAVIELKLRANKDVMQDAAAHLLEFMRILNYPIGVLVNINSDTTHLEPLTSVDERYVLTFATSIKENGIQVAGHNSQ